MKITRIALLCNLFLAGCYTDGLYVQEEWVDREFLASSVVGTPDPRQEHPPVGQRLLIGWDLPRSEFSKKPALHVTVWLWDNTLEKICLPLERRRGAEAFFFPNDEPGKDRRILTYRVDVVSPDGELLNSWEHHFWTKLIAIDSRESAATRSDSVSSQPMQESVIETP